MKNKFLSDLGLARRAGKLIRGRDETEANLDTGVLSVVFLAVDVSERTRLLAQRMCEEHGVRLRLLSLTMEELGQAAGCKPFGIFSVTGGFVGLLEACLGSWENKEAEK